MFDKRDTSPTHFIFSVSVIEHILSKEKLIFSFFLCDSLSYVFSSFLFFVFFYKPCVFVYILSFLFLFIWFSFFIFIRFFFRFYYYVFTSLCSSNFSRGALCQFQLEEYVDSATRVLLVPSIRDANHDFVFPQVIVNWINMDIIIFVLVSVSV